jgi:hypothetical protein
MSSSSSIKAAAHAYRVAQAQKILDVFEDTHGHPAHTMQELTEWTASPEGKAALAPFRTLDGTIDPYEPPRKLWGAS